MDQPRIDLISRAFAQRRTRRATVIGSGLGLVVAAVGGGRSMAQEATPVAPAMASPFPEVAESEKVPFMFVQSFGAGSLTPKAGADGILTLTADHLTGQTIYFSDRPERIVGMVSTERFLGTGSTNPDAGLGFTAANPPNAALVFSSAAGDDAPGDVMVVELLDPTYDPVTHTATYDVRVLADYNAVDVTLDQAPLTEAEAARDFTAASLFIDDCSDGTVICYSNGEEIGVFGPMGMCYDWVSMCCAPCTNKGQETWANSCNNELPKCNGECFAFDNSSWTCNTHSWGP